MRVRTEPRNLTRKGRFRPPGPPGEDGPRATDSGICGIVAELWHFAKPGTRLRKCSVQWRVVGGSTLRRTLAWALPGVSRALAANRLIPGRCDRYFRPGRASPCP